MTTGVGFAMLGLCHWSIFLLPLSIWVTEYFLEQRVQFGDWEADEIMEYTFTTYFVI